MQSGTKVINEEHSDMKVAIEARALTSQRAGVNRYVRNLLTKLLLRDEQISCYPIFDAPVELDIELSKAAVVKRYGAIGLNWWLNSQVEKRLQDIQPDVVHYTKADVPRHKRWPTVVTIYDVIPLLMPSSQKLSRRWYWPRALSRAAHESDHILTISEASKRDICEKLQVVPDKISVTRLGVDDHFRDLPARSNGKANILFVGTIEPRKNIGALLKAFAKIHQQIPHSLIIAGKAYKGSAEWMDLARKLKIEDRVNWRGFVSEEELRGLYSQADLFVWPSVYEGWGFPPQEAMACGVPVIVSNGGALPEVVGDSGEIVNFYKDSLKDRLHDESFIDDLSSRMLAVLQDKNKQAAMIEKGRKRAMLTSWDEVTDKTVEVYKKVAG